MKNSSEWEWFSVGMILLMLVGLFYLRNCYDDLQQQAVDRGFAEWRIIKGSKETEFKWKGEE